jgi:hypothetical protein
MLMGQAEHRVLHKGQSLYASTGQFSFSVTDGSRINTYAQGTLLHRGADRGDILRSVGTGCNLIERQARLRCCTPLICNQPSLLTCNWLGA